MAKIEFSLIHFFIFKHQIHHRFRTIFGFDIMLHALPHPLDKYIDPSLPLEEAECLTDIFIQLGFPLPLVGKSFPKFGYIVKNGHITHLAVSFGSENPPTTFFSSVLTHIPYSIENLSNLEYINLRGNLIRSLPNELFSMKHLSYLNLENNPLDQVDLDKVASKFNKLTALKGLFLKDTAIILPYNQKDKLRNIQYLDLDFFY